MDASAAAVSSRLIGAIFVEKGLVTPDQLARAMQIQEETGDRLGEIIVSEFGVARLELASVLAEQWAEFERTDQAQDEDGAGPVAEPSQLEAEPVEPLLRRPIGSIFVDRGFVTEEQLERAVDVQSKTGQRIGEVLVEQGSLSRLDLASALAEQWSNLQKLRPPEPEAQEPWQGGAVAAPAPTAASPELRAELGDLESRVRVIERAAAASPWEDDLGRLSSELRAALEALEHRLAGMDGGATSTEGVDAAIAELRERIDAPAARLEELERRVAGTVTADQLDGRLAALDQLSNRLDQLAKRTATPAGLEELQARVAELSAGSAQSADLGLLRADIAALAQRVEASEAAATRADLVDKLAAVAGQAESAQAGLAALASRLDDLTVLQDRVTGIADRLPGDEIVEEMRRALSELASRASDATAEEHAASMGALVARLDQLTARVEEIASGSRHAADDELRAAVEGLRTSLDELQARRVDDGAALMERLETLERNTPDVTSADVAAVAGTLEEQRSQFEARLGELAAALSDTSALDNMRHRLEELARAVAASGEATDLDERITALESRLADVQPMTDLRAEVQRVVESAAGERASLERALLARVEAITSSVPAVDEFTELRGRVDDLATRPAVDEGLQAQVAELAARLDAAAAVAESVESLRQTFAALDAARANDARATAERLASLEQSIASYDGLAARLDAAASVGESVESLRQTFAGLDAARANDARATAERLAGLEQAIASLDGLASNVDAAAAVGESVESLRQTFAGLDAERANDARATGERLAGLEQAIASYDGLASRLDAAASVGESVESLRQTLAELDTERANDARETGERLAGLEQAIASFDGLEEKIRRVVTESDGALAGRIDEAQHRLAELGTVEGQLAGLRDDLASRAHASALTETETAFRSELETLAERLEHQERELAERRQAPDQTSRIDSIGVRLDNQTRDVHGRLAGLAADVNARIDGLELRTESIVGRDELGTAMAEQAESLAVELEALQAATREQERNLAEKLGALAERSSVDAVDERIAAAEASLAGGFHQLEAMRHETAARLEEAVGALRAELDGRELRVNERIAAQQAELFARHDEIVAQLGELHERSAVRDAREAALEARMNERMDGRVAELAERLASESARVQDEIEKSAEALRAGVKGSSDSLRAELDSSRQALHLELEGSRDAVRAEVGSLALRLDELHRLHHADADAARTAAEVLGARVDELHSLRAQDAEAAQEAAAEAGARLEQLAVSLRRESASARETADRVAARVEELEGVRADDVESTRIAAAELVARLDDLALRTAGAAAEAERGLREELSGVAARLEQQDAAGIEAREELRVELERVASSVGWRLERIEESLASDDSEALRAAVAEVERRLDAQLSQQDEQVRVTERALRKGLASLGERLADSETAYLEAGTALRRSIERLGAAVVEADAQMAGQIPVSEVEGYVAFAPTADGYRLVPVPGRPPELGAVVEIEGCEGPLVVTRYGRSPLPLDNRACAYLDRS